MGKASNRKKERQTVSDVKRSMRSPMWFWILLGVVIAVGLGLTAFAVLNPKSSKQSVKAPSGTQTISGLSQDHKEGDLPYPQFPPAGGAHNPVWQNCGVYAEPIRAENAVHSLEHGAVWITYPTSLDKKDTDTLDKLAALDDFVIVSPDPRIKEGEIFATAWGKQLKVSNADDSRLADFVKSFAKGPQTPEPNAVCTGGVGTPQAA